MEDLDQVPGLWLTLPPVLVLIYYCWGDELKAIPAFFSTAKVSLKMF